MEMSFEKYKKWNGLEGRMITLKKLNKFVNIASFFLNLF